jgi:hypothetical protein
MAGLLVFGPGNDWSASGGLFDWTLEYLMQNLSDQTAVARLREIVDNNLGSLWVSDFPPTVQQEIATKIEEGLVSAAERELPETAYKAEALDRLRALVDLAASAFGHPAAGPGSSIG